MATKGTANNELVPKWAKVEIMPPPPPPPSFFTAQSENGSHSSTVIYAKNLAAKELIAIMVLETITS